MTPDENRWDAQSRLAIIGIGVILLGGVLLRLWQLEAGAFGHPENLTSGLHMPEWMPPTRRRVDFRSLFFGTLNDGHPPLYYAFQLVWAKVLGTSLWVIRLPSVLFGAATIVVIYLIGARVASVRAGLIAAALLALHGHHVYYSQVARLYVFAAFFAALSTLLLLKARGSERPRDHVAYVLATAAALYSHIYCWPVVFAQMVWSGLAAAARRVSSRLLVSQVVAVLISTPVIALSIYQNPERRWSEDTIGYLAYGYAFDPVVPFWNEVPSYPGDSVVLRIVVTAALVLIGAFGSRIYAERVTVAPAVPLSRPLRQALIATGIVLAAGTAYFAMWATPRPSAPRSVLLALALIPLAIPFVLPAVMRLAGHRVLHRSWLVPLTRDGTLSVWLAFLPLLCMIGVSLARASLTARGTIIFLPFLLLAVAQGLDVLLRRPWIGRVALVAMLTMTALSARFYALAETAQRDYGGLARALQGAMAPDDLILITNRYLHAPLLFYFEAPYDEFIGVNHSEELARRKHRRVWAISWQDEGIDAEVRAAISGYVPGPVVSAVRARAEAFMRPDSLPRQP